MPSGNSDKNKTPNINVFSKEAVNLVMGLLSKRYLEDWVSFLIVGLLLR